MQPSRSPDRAIASSPDAHVAVVRRAIVDKNVRIPGGTTIGVDLEADRQRFAVSDGGVVVVAKGTELG